MRVPDRTSCVQASRVWIMSVMTGRCPCGSRLVALSELLLLLSVAGVPGFGRFVIVVDGGFACRVVSKVVVLFLLSSNHLEAAISQTSQTEAECSYVVSASNRQDAGHYTRAGDFVEVGGSRLPVWLNPAVMAGINTDNLAVCHENLANHLIFFRADYDASR